MEPAQMAWHQASWNFTGRKQQDLVSTKRLSSVTTLPESGILLGRTSDTNLGASLSSQVGEPDGDAFVSPC